MFIINVYFFAWNQIIIVIPFLIGLATSEDEGGYVIPLKGLILIQAHNHLLKQ